MFFLGGINSVLPYIIYLSLVWVFLIVGFSGKVLQARQLLSPRICHAEKHDLASYDHNIIQSYDRASTTQKITIHKYRPGIPWACFFPPEIKIDLYVPESCLAVKLHYYSEVGLRGPPASAFLI